MVTYKKTKTLTPETAAYIAGLIDGEGTVTLSRRHANENRQLVVSIANTERPLLEFVLTEVGVGKITRKRTARSHHTPSFAYAVSNRQALDLLQQLGPHLRSYKRLRTDLVLCSYERLTPRNGKYSDAQIRLRRQFEANFLAITARE